MNEHIATRKGLQTQFTVAAHSGAFAQPEGDTKSGVLHVLITHRGAISRVTTVHWGCNKLSAAST
eukprot:6162443-Amphidinium_carterae.1